MRKTDQDRKRHIESKLADIRAKYEALLKQGKEELSAVFDKLKEILHRTARALLQNKKLTKTEAEKFYISSEYYSLFYPKTKHENKFESVVTS